MNAEEFRSLSPERQAKLRNDFDFLNYVDISTINGEKFLTQDNIPLNAISKMPESLFVKDWILQFALNDRTGQNYFNYEKWGEISNKHIMCVLIVDDNDPDKILLVIKPIASYSLTPKERMLMKYTSDAMINSIQETLEGMQPQITTERVADEINKGIEDSVRTPLHEFIPIQFYHKHSVYPEALFKSFYVRDVIFAGQQVENDVLMRVKEIFEKEERDGCASLEEYQFIKQLCGKDYEIPYDKLKEHKEVKLNEEDNNKETEIKDDDDLLSC